MIGTYRQALEGKVPQEFHQALAEAVEDWGGQWDAESGQVELASTAGLRVGWLRGHLSIEVEGSQQILLLRIEEAHFALQKSAAVLLVLAALGGLFTMVWPFFAHHSPGLLELAPLAALLALGGWFLVAAKVRHAGPEEFLQSVVTALEPPVAP